MNAERLLAHFERISEAPDAIARLRRFILDLAVRGKLVEQDPEDEPAEELLGRISYEKARLARAGEIKKPKQLPEIDEAPFVVPSNWTWCRIREATSDRAQKVPSERFTYIDVGAINKEAGLISEPTILEPSEAPSRARKIVKKGDVIYSCVRPYLLNVAIVDLDFDPEPIASTAFAVLYGHELVLPRYLWITLRTPFMVNCVEEFQRGQAYPAINDADFSLLPFPLPPLAEQHRIVAKVDELMALCDQLEAARQQREQGRERLVAATLQRLNQPAEDPASFHKDASFALQVLPSLTTTPAQIKQLRQTILNLAVRGKLVEQDPEDEPAEKLLKRISAEKARLVKAGKTKNEKPIANITESEKAFDVPQAWEWIRLGNMCELITKGSSPKWQGVEYVAAEEGILFVTSENVGNYVLRKLDDLKYVEARFREIEPRSMLRKGDILMNLVGASIGRTALYNLGVEANINQAVALIRLICLPKSPCVNYLMHYLNSSTSIAFMLGSRVSTAQPNMSLTDARMFPIPLPPLAEQHRIVAKVDELMALCDQLEQQLSQADQQRRRLLEAVLAEALGGRLSTEQEESHAAIA
jgi:type I restriction enzyme S subunit